MKQFNFAYLVNKVKAYTSKTLIKGKPESIDHFDPQSQHLHSGGPGHVDFQKRKLDDIRDIYR